LFNFEKLIIHNLTQKLNCYLIQPIIENIQVNVIIIKVAAIHIQNILLLVDASLLLTVFLIKPVKFKQNTIAKTGLSKNEVAKTKSINSST